MVSAQQLEMEGASSASTSDFTLLYSPEVGSVEEVTEEPDECKRGRKRLRQPEKWTKKHVKKPGLRKNSPRVDLSNYAECCKKLCIQKFTTSHLNKVRDDFEKLFYEEQNLYLNGVLHRCVTKKSSGHSRKQNPTVSSSGKKVGRPPAEESQFSFHYSIRNEKGIVVRVCQKAFCAVHGFGPKCLQVLRRKVQAPGEPSITCTVEPDQRGKHDNRHVISEDVRDLIRAHIQSFPGRHSHYSRGDNSGRIYLSPELSIARLYQDFLQKHDPEFVAIQKENQKRRIYHEAPQEVRKPLVSEHFYHDLFVNEFNIHFGFPRSDSCGTCDSLRIKIDQASTDEEKQKLQKELDDHQMLAQKGYDTFHYDQKLSEKSWEKYK